MYVKLRGRERERERGGIFNQDKLVKHDKVTLLLANHANTSSMK